MVRPTQPAWATAKTPSGLSRTTGAQSAVRTAMAQPAVAHTAASATSPAPSPGPVTRTTRLPWTWRSHVHGRSTTARRRASTSGLTACT